ncbi:MAG: hypothetical protein IKN16_09700, partial [Selenomonadaceae bacterium]|nr:hypothetical protein [Selenomonadaceae bacterium]
MTNATFSFAYKDSNFKRDYKLEVADSVPAANVNDLVRNTAKAINQSLAGGTSGGLDTFFVADNYDAANSIGSFASIAA